MSNFITLEPIFNRDFNVEAYEIHFNEKSNSGNGLTNFFTELQNYDLPGICNGKKALVECRSIDMIMQLCETNSPDEIMIGLHSKLEYTPENIESIKSIKEKGYRIVLNNFEFQNNFLDVVPYCDIINLNYKRLGRFMIAAALDKMHPFGMKCLLTNIEEQILFNNSRNYGFDFFQGNFFKKAQHLPVAQIATSKLQALELLKEIHQPEMDYQKIGTIIRRDITISYKLMQLINSPAFGIRNEIKSINQALTMLGERSIKSWLSWIIFRDLGTDKPSETVILSLQRAKFLESLANDTGLGNYKSELYLLGLFSMIDVLLERPLKEILKDFPLDKEIKAALLGEESRYNDIYKLMLAYEDASALDVFMFADKYGTNEKTIEKDFMSAVQSAHEIFNTETLN